MVLFDNCRVAWHILDMTGIFFTKGRLTFLAQKIATPRLLIGGSALGHVTKERRNMLGSGRVRNLIELVFTPNAHSLEVTAHNIITYLPE